MASSKLLIGRFTGVTPVALFRIQGGAGVRLRREAAQKAAGRELFDVSVGDDGLVHPRDPAETQYTGPNGMLLRPKGFVFAIALDAFRGGAKTRVFEVPKGSPIPPELVLLHEHGDDYSLQPAVSMRPAQLDKALTAFLGQGQGQGVVCHSKGKEAFYEAHPDMHPMVVGFSRNA
jgi:hypothetical protein